MTSPSEIRYRSYDGGDFRRAVASIPPDALELADVMSYARELRRLCAVGGLRMAPVWAQAVHETNKFRSMAWGDLLNPAGIKTSKGAIRRYRNGVDAARAHVFHLSLYLSPAAITPELADELRVYSYLEGRERAVRAFVEDHGFAESLAGIAIDGEGWAEDKQYGEKVARLFDLIFRPPVTNKKLASILLVSGHRNQSGGNPEEASRTPALATAYLAELRSRGYWTEHLQAIDGDGDPDDTLGSLAVVANKANEWLQRQRATDRVPVMLDLHFEGGGSPGVFAIIPDAPSDSWEMNLLDNKLARAIVGKIHEQTGLTIRGAGVREPGVMSEKQTGVGADGFRLGMFSLTFPSRAFSVRLIVEHGSLDHDSDRVMNTSPVFPKLAAKGAANGIDYWVSTNDTALWKLAAW